MWFLSCNEWHRELKFPQNKNNKEEEYFSGHENMNVVEYLDPKYIVPQITYTIIDEKMKKIKHKIFDVARLARLGILNSMEEESKKKLWKEKYL